jgi:hypothetical protein
MLSAGKANTQPQLFSLRPYTAPLPADLHQTSSKCYPITSANSLLFTIFPAKTKVLASFTTTRIRRCA